MAKQDFSKLIELVDGEVGHITEVRRTLHAVPEPGFCEEKTARIIASELKKVDVSVQTGVAQTGVVADLDTHRPGPTVLMRGDMDALRIQERTGLSYCSQNADYAHSCGHDGHSAAVLGAACVLSRIKADLRGRVRFIFQPAEEICKGAKAMIEAGVLTEKPPDAILSLHAWPGIEPDEVACRDGTMMASCDEVHINVIGRGGHGARPHLARNPLIAMGRVVEKLRKLDNRERIVSLCTARVGNQANVIAGRGRLSGTVRTLNRNIRRQTLADVERVAKEACAELGMQAEVSFETMSQPVITDKKLYTVFQEVGTELLGRYKVLTLSEPSMGSEDFGLYLEYAPGLMFRVGMGKDRPNLHESTFDFNDAALKTAMLVLCGMTVRLCGKGTRS